jgi:predicted dehydrogenase
MNNRIKIGLVGCGALTKIFYQPVLNHLGIKPFALADPFIEKSKALAKEWGAEKSAASAEEILDDVDAVIIASPNFLHASQAKLFLEKGKHVLLEKPMTVSGLEGQSLIESSKSSGAVLQIAMMRRFWKLNKAVKKILEDKLLGNISEISMLEGGIMNWPAQSVAMFDKRQSLGGVLIDTGSHTLDLLCWWMQDDTEHLQYADDNRGGVETDCELLFRFKSSGAKTKIELTRIRNLQNEYLLKGEKGWIMIKPFGNGFESSDPALTKQIFNIYNKDNLKNQTIYNVFDEQVRSWLHSIKEGTKPSVDAASVLPSIQLIEKCYKERTYRSYPWEN